MVRRLPTVRAQLQLLLALQLVNGSVGYPGNFRSRDRHELLQKMSNLHVNWYVNAVGGLITAIGKRTLKQSPQESQLRYNFCLRTAADLTERAKCALNTFQERENYGNKRQFHPMKKSARAPRKRRSSASTGNSSRKPTMYYFANSATIPTTPSTTPYPSPIEALSRLVVHAVRGGNELNDPAHQSPTVSKLQQLHSVVKDNVGRRQSRRVEILSPRLAPLLPRTSAQSKRIYSPSFLSFYRDNALDNVVSLPDVLDDAGMTSNDQTPADFKEALLEMVLEVSGARRTIDDIFQAIQNEQDSGMGGQILNATRRIDQVWAQVRKSYSWRQHRDLLDDGFTFLRRDQLERLYGENGLYEGTALGLDLDKYEKWTWKDKEDFLKNNLRLLASEPRAKRHRRAELAHPKPIEGNSTSERGGKQKEGGEKEDKDEEDKDEEESTATTLAPFAFSASVLSPSLLGPVTLSPSLFTPAILSPAVLGPTTLSPAIGNPTILSPYVLGPTILSPGILAPGVLSPYVLSPNILNFFVLSPAILSPAVLSPDILSPTLLSPTILSPFVLSPAIYSEALDESPIILSPSVLSK